MNVNFLTLEELSKFLGVEDDAEGNAEGVQDDAEGVQDNTDKYDLNGMTQKKLQEFLQEISLPCGPLLRMLPDKASEEFKKRLGDFGDFVLQLPTDDVQKVFAQEKNRALILLVLMLIRYEDPGGMIQHLLSLACGRIKNYLDWIIKRIQKDGMVQQQNGMVPILNADLLKEFLTTVMEKRIGKMDKSRMDKKRKRDEADADETDADETTVIVCVLGGMAPVYHTGLAASWVTPKPTDGIPTTPGYEDLQDLINLVWDQLLLSGGNPTQYLAFTVKDAKRLRRVLVHCIDHGIVSKQPIKQVHSSSNKVDYRIPTTKVEDVHSSS